MSPTPPVAPLASAPVLAIVIAGADVIGTVAERCWETFAPEGGVAVAVAVFAIEPASTSDCFTV